MGSFLKHRNSAARCTLSGPIRDVDVPTCRRHVMLSFLCLSWRRNWCPWILMDGQIFIKNRTIFMITTIEHGSPTHCVIYGARTKTNIGLRYILTRRAKPIRNVLSSNPIPHPLPSPSQPSLVPLAKMPQFNALGVDNGIVDNTRIRRAMWAWAGWTLLIGPIFDLVLWTYYDICLLTCLNWNFWPH